MTFVRERREASLATTSTGLNSHTAVLCIEHGNHDLQKFSIYCARHGDRLGGPSPFYNRLYTPP